MLDDKPGLTWLYLSVHLYTVDDISIVHDNLYLALWVKWLKEQLRNRRLFSY